ncbi:response regulator [Zoogloea sp. LCSB751]|uniref:hybrid sensor histidine kinase/response regulator n=1 Tax=Zoogloea sp. LCSB751 TaxID=1965277 RepID=UPI0009A4AB1C|nr:response regulator [Zoogloea sp. LCSB751]
MSAPFHALASRLGLRSLGQQLTFLFAALLTLSIGAYSLYIGLEQAAYVERLERRHGDELGQQMAAALEPHMATGDATRVQSHLQQLQTSPSIRRLTVTDRRGTPIASVIRTHDNAPLEAEAIDATPLMPPTANRQASTSPAHTDSETLLSWSGIGEHAPLGWLRVEMKPVAANESFQHIIEDSALASLLTLVAGTTAILYFLRPPLRSLERATNFAESLESSQGSVLAEPSSINEIRKLVDALNWTSIRLFDGQAALTASESRNRAITEAALDCIITVDSEGRIIEFNPAAERTFGVPRSKVLHQSYALLFFPERLRQAQSAELTKLLTDTQLERIGQRIEGIAVRQSGEEFPVELALVAVESDGQRLVTAYLRDISERKAAEAYMRDAKEAAEANSRSKSDFLANMSHEIRTPMNAILGMTDLALDTELDDEQREYLLLVKSSANALLNIINDILDFSKIEAGKLDFEHIDFSLRDCVALAVRTLQQRAAEKDLQLTAQISPDVPDSLMGDPHRLRQVLINLLSNGIKFTTAGSVTLLVQPGQAGDVDGKAAIHFRVQDTGVGIPAEKQSLIFDAFSQADTSTTRRYGGTGLGLTISAQLVQAMDGHIGVESTPGHGSTFHFTAHFDRGQHVAMIDEEAHLDNLPVLVAVDNPTERAMLVELLSQWRMAPLAMPDAASSRRELADACANDKPFRVVIVSTQLPDAEGFQLVEEIPRVTRPQPCIVMLAGEGRRGDGARCRELGVSAYLPMPVQASDLLNAILLSVEPIHAAEHERALITRHTLREQRRQLRILLAEDNIVNQTLALRLLEKLGHQVEVANNGAEAVELHAHGHFDIILMDVQMPVLGGFEATARIREREAAGMPRTPIIAMTAHAMKGDRERCLEAGMDGYLSKPVHAPDLVEVLISNVGNDDPAPPPATESAPSGAPVFDKEKVLANLGDDEELLGQLIEMYSEDEPRMLSNVDKAVAAGDAESLYSSAHALKGAVSNFCAEQAQAKAQQLERMGREKQLANAPAVLAELHQELLALREAFGLPPR